METINPEVETEDEMLPPDDKLAEAAIVVVVEAVELELVLPGKKP